MSSKAKRKGKYLEDLVAKVIQEKWDLTKFDVHRNQTSGVFQTEFGDIYFKDIDFIIECKNQESWDMKHLFYWNKPITDWWKQLINDVCKFIQIKGYEPLYSLVVGRSRYPKFMIFEIQNLLDTPVLKDFSLDRFLNRLSSYMISKNKSYLICDLEEAVFHLKDYIQRYNG